MFFTLSKLLDVALSPLFWLGVAVLLGVSIAGRPLPPWRRLMPIAGLMLVYVLALEPTSDALARVCEAGATNTTRSDRSYDAVIVLGGLVDGVGASAEELASYNDNVERLHVGYELLRTGRARVAVLSGGSWDPNDPPEAEVLAKQLLAWGIPEERIVVEPASRNTRENAVRTAELVRAKGLGRLALVTSAFHMPRAMGCFRAVGLEVDTLPVDRRYHPQRYGLRSWLPRTADLERSSAMLRELAGRVVYRVAGYAR